LQPTHATALLHAAAARLRRRMQAEGLQRLDARRAPAVVSPPVHLHSERGRAQRSRRRIGAAEGARLQHVVAKAAPELQRVVQRRLGRGRSLQRRERRERRRRRGEISACCCALRVSQRMRNAARTVSCTVRSAAWKLSSRAPAGCSGESSDGASAACTASLALPACDGRRVAQRCTHVQLRDGRRCV
jgi:hypothetical protein